MDTDPTISTAEHTSAPSVHFAKIAATPTSSSWSQAYNAGTLFAVISVRRDYEAETPLSTIGKDILSTLEEEFFTLEEKSLSAIKQALTIVVDKIPQDVSATLLVACLPRSAHATDKKKEHVVYFFTYGHGKILLKRDNSVGHFSGKKEELLATSGHLKNSDIMVLETNDFEDIIPKNTLKEALDQQSPSDIAEVLAPLVHEKEEGGACAIVISYAAAPHHETAHSTPVHHPEPIVEKQPEPVTPSQPEIPTLPLTTVLSFFPKKVSKSKKLMITIALVLCFVLGSSIYFATQKRQQQKDEATLASIMDPAQKKFDEGQSIASLNKNLARTDFEDAKKILEDGKPKLTKDSDEEKKLDELLTKVNKSLEEASKVNKTPAKVAASDASKLLAFEAKNNTSYIVSDDKLFYFATDEGIVASDKSTGSKKNHY
jgi:hypothetical protein